MNRLTAYLCAFAVAAAVAVAAAATIALAQGRVRASSNSGLPLVANPQALPSTTDTGVMAQAVIDRGLAALKAKQNPDGGWQGPNDPPA